MLEGLQAKVALGQWEFSLHATRQMIARHMSTADVAQAIATGKIIEDYPADKGMVPVPCCWGGRSGGGRCTSNALTRPAHW